MRLVTREDLRTTIAVALAVLKPYKKTAPGLHESMIRDQVVDDLVERIMGLPENKAVILQPYLVGRGCHRD